jgi:hypothetical protein
MQYRFTPLSILKGAPVTKENDDLRVRIERLERQQAACVSVLWKMENKNAALRAAVMALIYHAPQGVLTEDFSIFLGQFLSDIPIEHQILDLWEEIVSAIEHNRRSPTH